MRTTQSLLRGLPYSLSSLGRSVDPGYRSNVLAVASAVIAGFTFWLYNSIAGSPLATSGLAAGVAVFLAWAIGREIDPDRDVAATAAMVVAFLAALQAEPSLLLGAGLLMATRLISGTVGMQLKPVDMMVLFGLAALLGSDPLGLAALPALVVGVVVVEKRSAKSYALAASMAGAAVVTWMLAGASLDRTRIDPSAYALLAVTMAALVLILPAPQPRSRCDVGGLPLLARRITASRLAVGGTVIAAVAVAGGSGFSSISGTGGAAIVGAAVVHLFGLGQSRRRQPVGRGGVR